VRLGAGPLPQDTRLMLLAIEADLQPFELRDYLRAEIERRRADHRVARTSDAAAVKPLWVMA